MLQVDLPTSLEQTLAAFIGFLPRLLGAVVILLIGWVVGVLVGRVVRSLIDRTEIDKKVLETPLGRMMGRSERAVSRTFGVIAKWFVYAIAILAAANVLAIALLSEWIQTVVSYLPAFVAGLAVILLGFIVADFVGDAIMRTRAATQTEYTAWFAAGTRMFLYFTAIVIGLDTMGIDVQILYVFANAVAWGVAAAIALGAGIALGWGAHTYVAENIDRWAGTASTAAPSPRESAQADGSGIGEESGDQ
ncbi:mechanosensitive ion channel family protein [Halobellus sp. GM3]|uniref:mechanosensitive ion channel family protein n=1 Tax=Halobellus sp. GM3 TaxID=3458410 RepID=UPI00403E2307